MADDGRRPEVAHRPGRPVGQGRPEVSPVLEVVGVKDREVAARLKPVRMGRVGEVAGRVDEDGGVGEVGAEARVARSDRDGAGGRDRVDEDGQAGEDQQEAHPPHGQSG